MSSITLGSLLNPNSPAPKLFPDPPKLCKDCKWVGTNGSGIWQQYICGAPQNPHTINLVAGHKEYAVKFCQEQREATPDLSNFCTTEGYWYEYYERPVFQTPVVQPTVTKAPSKSRIPTAEEL